MIKKLDAYERGYNDGMQHAAREAADLERPDRVSIHGMYDCHCFHKIEGGTVDEIIDAWLAHNKELHPAILGDRPVDDLGQSSLCPAILLRGTREIRRVGQMVFPDYKNRGEPRRPADLDAYRKALRDDPDISRLLERA